jgi:hypothetical protein
MAGHAAGAFGVAITLGATAVARKAVDATWKLGSGKKPPTDPADPDVRMREAMLWAVLSGAAVGVAKMWASRQLAKKDRHEHRAVTAAQHMIN